MSRLWHATLLGMDHPARKLTDAVVARALRAPLAADSVAPPRLVYGGLDLRAAAAGDGAYAAIYFCTTDGGALGRVTFEGLDAIRGSRGEHLPHQNDDPSGRSWVFVVDASAWLAERHDYETRHYETPLLESHRHYLFQFHDEFIEAIAEGIWFDTADPARPFAEPARHPLKPFDLDVPCETFHSPSGLEWELRRSPLPERELLDGARYCSQRLFQFNLVLDGASRESASIWLRNTDSGLVSRLSLPWVGEVARLDGVARPEDFAHPWETHLAEVAQRRRQMGK